MVTIVTNAVALKRNVNTSCNRMKPVRFRLSTRTAADASHLVESGEFESLSEIARHAVRLYDERLRRGEIPPILHLSMVDCTWVSVRIPEGVLSRIASWAGLRRGEILEYALRSYLDDWARF